MKSVDSASVLIVENNPNMCAMLRVMLEAFPVGEIREAHNVQDAVPIANAALIDLIILDYYLGGPTGADFARAIRRNVRCLNRTTPILMLTAAAGQRDILDMRDAGVHEILAKPVQPHDLYVRMHQVLTNPRKFIVTESYVGPCRRRVRKDYPAHLERRADRLAELTRPARIGAPAQIAEAV